MPLTVRKFNAQVKDPQSGQMIPAGLLSSDSLQAIEAAESAAITEIQQKGTQTRDSIPDDYTELSDSVDELKTQLEGVIDGKDLIVYDIIPNSYPTLSGFSTYDSWDRSDYIPVVAGEVININNPSHATNDNVWYNSGKEPQTKFSIPIGSPTKLTVPDGISYMVISNDRSTFFGDVWRNVDAYANRAEFDAVKTQLNDAETDIEKLIIHVPFDRQLFDVSTMIPDAPYILAVQSSRSIVSNSGTRLYPIEVNGKAGETYAFNIVANDSGEPQDYSSCSIYADNALPEAGNSVLQIGNASPTNKRGLITLANDSKYIIIGIQSTVSSYPYDPYTEACNLIMEHLVLRKSNEYDTTYYQYEEYDKYLVVPFYQGSDYVGKILKVNAEGVLELANESGGGSSDGSVYYATNKTVYVGDNALGTATLGSGWTESNGVYTHANGNTADLEFSTSLNVGDIAILDFDTTYSTNEFINVGIGTAYRILCYNGTTHIRVPLKAIGNTTLYLTPFSTFSGSISNLTLRIIQETGTEIELEYFNTLTENHENTFGFWNTFLGDLTAENAVGTTRSIAIGSSSLRDLQGGHRNIGIGTFAMSQLIGGERNIAIGADAMLEIKHGEHNVALGDGALYHGSNVNYNIAIGASALASSAGNSPAQNVAIGGNSGAKTTGSNNVFVGHNSGYRNTSGNKNVIIGDSRGPTGGNNNTLVGADIQSDSSLTDSIGLGKDAIPTKNNQMMLGSSAVTEVVFCGNKKINFNQDGTVTWELLT